jgi:uncharacterized protein YbjT (DUF2867 family)
MTRYGSTDGDEAKRNRTILVAGATGKQGGPAVRHLLHDGWAVRALVRDPGSAAAKALAQAGAVLVHGDLDAPETLTAAVEGAYGVFAASPAAYGTAGFDTELEFARGAALVDAAAAAGVAHFVFASIATIPGYAAPGSVGKRRIEARIEASGVRWTHLRPVRFMENYLLETPLGEGIPRIDGIHDGVHRHLFRPDRPMKVIAVEDIAEVARLVFADLDRFAGRALGLAGDEITPVAAAAAIAEATGIEVRYQRFTRAEAAAMGPEIAAIWEVLDNGGAWDADAAALRELHPGLRTFDTWLKEGGADRITAQQA